MQDHLSVGVVGHVDHGKTTLVKSLTGTETDRLAEERERGLSIVLGFAFRETDKGVIDFIDAPGHADFVRTMISGATGIDAALVVVDVNEGIMPQTCEHLRIVSLLGISRLVVALTKIDLATDGVVASAEAALRTYLSSVGFSDVVFVPVCALSGQGVDRLVAALEQLFQKEAEQAHGDKFYLPFDRVFTVRGFGTVVTGTLRAGTMKIGDEGQIIGTNAAARVRRLEVHGTEVDVAKPGQRVAANLRVDGGVTLERGQAVAAPGWIEPSEWWSASLNMAGDVEVSLKNGKPVRLLHGTREVIATLRLLDRDIVAPGEQANVQFHLKQPEGAWDQEHFIVRTISPVETVGGGRFLDTAATRIKRYDENAIRRLASGEAEDDGVDPSESMIEAVQAYHASHPMRVGMPRLELADKLGLERQTMTDLLARLQAAGRLIDHGAQISLADFDPLESLDDRERARVEALESLIRETPLMPPTLDEVVALDRQNKASAELLIETGKVVPLHDFKRKNLFLFHATDIEDAVASLRQAWPPPARFRLGEAREHLGVTRKFLQPLLEYLDKQKITQRREDFREMLS